MTPVIFLIKALAILTTIMRVRIAIIFFQVNIKEIVLEAKIIKKLVLKNL